MNNIMINFVIKIDMNKTNNVNIYFWDKEFF